MACLTAADALWDRVVIPETNAQGMDMLQMVRHLLHGN